MKWKYKVHEEDESFIQTVKCHIYEKEEPCDFMFKANSIRESSYYYNVDNNSINMIKTKVDAYLFPKKITVEFSDGCPIFFLSEDIKNWEWEGKVNVWFFNKKVELNASVMGYDSVNTKIGKFNCIKLRLIYKNGSRSQKHLAWYAKNIGLVKFNSPKQKKKIINFNEK